MGGRKQWKAHTNPGNSSPDRYDDGLFAFDFSPGFNTLHSLGIEKYCIQDPLPLLWRALTVAHSQIADTIMLDYDETNKISTSSTDLHVSRNTVDSVHPTSL